MALSGGQAARASLAAILLSRFDVLLLDEPTNDLDFDGLARLERFVAERPGGAVIVSHDRAFLERTVTRVLELDEIAHTAAEYGGGWAGYLELRATAARHAEDALRDLLGAARPAHRPRPARQRQWSETRRAKAKASKGSRARQERSAHHVAERSEKQAVEGARDREGDRAARRRSTSRGSAGSCSCASAAASAPATSPCASTAPSCGAAASRSARSTSSSRGASAWRWSARTAAARRRSSTALLGQLAAQPRARAGSARACGSARSTRRARGFDGAGALIDAFVEQSGMTQQDARSLLAKFGLESDAVARAAAQPLPRRAHPREPRAADGLRRELPRARRADQPPRPPGDRAARDRAGRLRRHAAARHPRPPAARGGRRSTARSSSPRRRRSASCRVRCAAATAHMLGR